MKYLHMQKLQHLYATSNLLTKFQTEKSQSLPVYHIPDVYEVRTQTGDIDWEIWQLETI